MILSIITIPMTTSIAILLLGRYLGQKGSVLISLISIGLSMTGGIKLLYRYLRYNEEITINIYNWINTGMLNISFSLLYDKYSIFMVFLITTITFVVLSFSTWYMYDDPHKNRFISMVQMFAVTMLVLVSSSNLFIMFVGWEGVGIMSYLLINFWYFSINSNKSAIKAILYNKIGDIGLIIGIAFVYLNSSFITINNTINDLKTIILLVFIIASIAKSAQIFLHPWLGDAMAGPTPVSALLHAATMVTAGVFLLFRLESLILDSGPFTRGVIIIIGLFTIIFGGLSSINQNDIKKIIAFSTSSQLGYMFLSNGLLIPNVGFFHLLTHGFFKAMLFLTAGILIHNCKNEQDIRKFGSLIFTFPLSFFFFFLASLSMISFPFLSGFYSKEAILESSLNPLHPIVIYQIMLMGVILTSIYSFKLLFFTFFSNNNNKNNNNNIAHSGPILWMAPVMGILVIGSIFFGYLTKDIVAPYIGGDCEFLPFYIKLIPLLLGLSGILFAFVIIQPFGMVYLLTILNKRLFLDCLVNYFFGLKTPVYGGFKLIDRGFLESAIGLFRIFYSIPFYFNYNNKSHDTQYDTLFLYLFFSFLLFFLFLPCLHD